MDDVKREAQESRVEVLVPTTRAIQVLVERSRDTNTSLHVRC
jgi:hypothetical protein